MYNVINSISTLLGKNKLMTAAGLFLAASMLANIFNWLLSILAGRVLDTDEFAVFAVFISIVGLISVPANALSTTVSRYYAYFSGKKSTSSIEALTSYYMNITLIFGTISVFIVYFTHDYTRDFLKLPSDSMVVGFTPVAFFLFTAAYFRGILKGKLQFGIVGLMMIIETLTKLVLLFTGYLLNLPLLVIAILSLPISWSLATLIGSVGNFFTDDKSRIIKKSEVSEFSKVESHFFMINAFFASIGMMLMNSVDILLVKHYFSDSDAGTYALLSLFGKILYFGAGSFIELFVPLTAKSHAENSQNRIQFLKLIGLVSSVAIPTLFAFLLFPNHITYLFLKDKGALVIPYLAPYLFATTFLLYTNCFNAYNTAKRHFISTYLITVMAVIQGGLIFIWHNSLIEVVNIVLITQCVLFMLVLIYEFFIWPKQYKNLKSTSSSLIGRSLAYERINNDV